MTQFVQQQLFRQQVLQQHTDRLHGELLLLPRLSHSLLLVFLLIWVSIVILWLATSHYARRETVLGWLEPDAGIARVYADQPGRVAKLLVAEGEVVAEGQPLLFIDEQRALSDGQGLEAVLLGELRAQRARLDEQVVRTQQIHVQRQTDIDSRLANVREDLALIELQAQTQASQQAMATSQLARLQALRVQGHVSQLELERAQTAQLAQRQQQQALARDLVNQRHQIELLLSEQALLPQQQANERDQLLAQQSDSVQQIARIQSQSAYVVKAPRAGLVSNLQARPGQQARTGVPLLTLVPEGGALTAQLLVPVRAAGFVVAGQAIDIRYDAFPYQKFGLYGGEVLSVSESVLLPNEWPEAPVAIAEPVYRVRAKLSHPDVQAYGRQLALKPGMTLSADLRLEERTLFQWLLEPLYSLRGRI